MSGAARWADLWPRLASGVVLIVVGAVEIWLGGLPFAALVCVLAGAMMWEAARMFAAPDALRSGVLAAVALALALWLPGIMVLPLLLAAVVVASSSVARERGPFFALALWALLGCYAMGTLRAEAGLVWVLWLVAVVVISDVAGYFAGRILGGPKFWPRFSPKKTWSGTVAGWILAALVGVAFVLWAGMPWAVVPISAVLAFAGQLGDIAESAIKRRMGVKDSSNLIPGHGGVLDRFDAIIAVAALALVLALFGAFAGLTA